MNHGWEIRPLQDICNKASSNLMQKNIDSENGKYPVFGASGIAGYIDYYVQAKDYIGIIKDGSGVGRVSVYPKESSLLGTLQYIIPNENMDLRYVAYALKSMNLAKYVSGAAIPHIYFRDYGEEKIAVPSIKTQSKVADELDKLNELIEIKRNQIKDLDALAQSLFYETFGDPIAPPKGWNTKVWSDLFDTILGKMLDKNKQIETDIQLPYLANQNVQWGYFDLSKLNTMSFTQNEVAKFRLKEGDILICEGGESGRCAIWKGADYTILFQKAIHRARIKDRNIINPYFVRFWLEIFKKNDGLKNHLTKATIEHLTGAKLKTVNVPVPPIALQEQFAARIEAIEEQKKRVEASIADLETILASRMDYWFND